MTTFDPTTALAAKEQVVAIFKAALDGNSSAEAWFGRPRQKKLPEANVYVENIVSGTRDWRNLAAGARRGNQVDEDYTIEFCVELLRRNGKLDETEPDAWAIVKLLETALGQNVNLGGTVQYALVTKFEMTTDSGTDGVEAVYDAGIGVVARV